jgi:hypothetical protein
MEPAVLIVQVNGGYRVLHGHLHLVNTLNLEGEVEAQISDGEKVKIVKTATGVLVDKTNAPLLFNEK